MEDSLGKGKGKYGEDEPMEVFETDFNHMKLEDNAEEDQDDPGEEEMEDE